MSNKLEFSAPVQCTAVKSEKWYNNYVIVKLSLGHDTTTIDAEIVVSDDEPLPVKGQMYSMRVELLPVD